MGEGWGGGFFNSLPLHGGGLGWGFFNSLPLHGGGLGWGFLAAPSFNVNPPPQPLPHKGGGAFVHRAALAFLPILARGSLTPSPSMEAGWGGGIKAPPPPCGGGVGVGGRHFVTFLSLILSLCDTLGG
jgi:hypothetical protein